MCMCVSISLVCEYDYMIECMCGCVLMLRSATCGFISVCSCAKCSSKWILISWILCQHVFPVGACGIPAWPCLEWGKDCFICILVHFPMLSFFSAFFDLSSISYCTLTCFKPDLLISISTKLIKTVTGFSPSFSEADDPPLFQLSAYVTPVRVWLD